MHMAKQTKSTRGLVENVFTTLPLGSIRPAEWLSTQLRIQADGLTGHLDEFWPDIADSAWIGGKGEGWERGPYWLDGLVPLAFLLDDERLKQKAQHWITSILHHQQSDGWLGPFQDANYGYPYDPWPVFVLLKAMTQYQEATGDHHIIAAIERCMQKLRALLAQQPLTSWAMLRSTELALSMYWLYERTGEAWLLDFAQTVRQQSFDWLALYQDFPYTTRQHQWTFQSHVVNNAMAIKYPAVWYRLSHDLHDRRASTSCLLRWIPITGRRQASLPAMKCLPGRTLHKAQNYALLSSLCSRSKPYSRSSVRSPLLIGWNASPLMPCLPRLSQICGRINMISRPIKCSAWWPKIVSIPPMALMPTSLAWHQTMAVVPPICTRAGPNVPVTSGCVPPMMAWSRWSMLHT